MAGSSNQFYYQIGATQLAVGLSQTIQVLPGRGQDGWVVSLISAGSSGTAFVQGASNVASQGVPVPTAPLRIDGPATFFLASAGSTGVVGLMPLYSAGFSSLP